MPSPDATPTPDAPTEELATFDPRLADAVAAVLTQAGVPTVLDEAPGGERSVLVPPARRAEALATLASRMDDVQALAAPDTQRPGGAPGGPALWPPPVTTTGAPPVTSRPRATGGDGDGEDRPLVLERFRSFGWVAVALVPLLVITLANVRLPAGVLVAVVVGSVVLVSAWRSGRLGGEG